MYPAIYRMQNILYVKFDVKESLHFTLIFKNHSWQNATDTVSSYIVKN